MKELTALIPLLAPAVSISAALIVVSVATLKTLTASYPPPTAVVLALGVTIMGLVGTAPVILVGSPAREPAVAWRANGSALMLLPFLTLAISRLLCDLLVAAADRAAERGPRPGVRETMTDGKTIAASAQESKQATTNARPRGRPRKQPPKERSGVKHVEQHGVEQTLAAAANKEHRQGANVQ